MESRIRNQKVGDWVQPGPWFDSFAELPRLIDAYQTEFGGLKRVLITGPSPSFMSLAMALGASVEALKSNEDVSLSHSFEKIVENILLKISFEWVETEAEDAYPVFDDAGNDDEFWVEKVLTRTVRVGRVTQVKAPNQNLVTLALEIDGTIERVALHLPRILSGAISFSVVPEGTPHGVFTQKINVYDSDVERWKFFMSQNNPQYAFFGDGKFLSTITELDYFEPTLCESLLGDLMQISMVDATRLDQLSNDTALHFINSYDQISKFPKPGSTGFSSLKLMKGVVLVGNRAIDLLAKKSAIADHLQIALLGTSEGNMQDQALQSFAMSASYYTQITEFQNTLGWTAPSGVQIWGWN